MPIGQLRRGIKNIKLSSKNKLDFSRDFNDFVEEKKRSMSVGVYSQQRKTAAIIAKRDKKSFKKMKTEPAE